MESILSTYMNMQQLPKGRELNVSQLSSVHVGTNLLRTQCPNIRTNVNHNSVANYMRTNSKAQSLRNYIRTNSNRKSLPNYIRTKLIPKSVGNYMRTILKVR